MAGSSKATLSLWMRETEAPRSGCRFPSLGSPLVRFAPRGVLEKSGDCLTCHRSAVRNWVRRQDPKNLRTAKYCLATVPSTDTVLLRFSFLWCRQISHDADRSPLPERRGNNARQAPNDREQA
jgi:hypothetical protein